tara:strand:+ start:1728 stop:2264 length:537 start_codon:yes stop_codon:yes gene_type:complete
VSDGEILLIKGKNGSGKTSLLRALSGLLEPDQGQILWNNIDITKDRQEYHQNLSWLSHKHGFKKELSVKENLEYELSLRSNAIHNFDYILNKLSLDKIKNRPFGILSAGQKRRASLARMIISNATLYLLDEPGSNLDSEGQEIVRSLVIDHTKNNGICVMATHQDTFERITNNVIELA